MPPKKRLKPEKGQKLMNLFINNNRNNTTENIEPNNADIHQIDLDHVDSTVATDTPPTDPPTADPGIAKPVNAAEPGDMTVEPRVAPHASSTVPATEQGDTALATGVPPVVPKPPSTAEQGDMPVGTAVVSKPPSTAEQGKIPVVPVIHTAKRNFQQKWLLQYHWLRYCEKTLTMSCTICIQHGRKNTFTEGNNNFRTSTISDHLKTNDHKTALVAPKLKANLEKATNKANSKQEMAIVIALKAVYWLAMEALPLHKFKSLLELLTDLEVPHISHLQLSDKIRYESSYTSTALLEAINATLEDELKEKLEVSPVVTALADESTDIAVHKRLGLYAQLINPVTMTPSTDFITNVQLTLGTGVAIATAIYEQFMKRGVTPKKVMGLGSDGATVMTGQGKGTTGIMLRENPHMVNIHCVAHRLNLCTSQASHSIDALKDYQDVLTNLYKYFKDAPNRIQKFSSIQQVLESPQIRMKEVHEIRWLAFYNALDAVYRSLDALLTYLAEMATNKDPKAVYLKKKVIHFPT